MARRFNIRIKKFNLFKVQLHITNHRHLNEEAPNVPTSNASKWKSGFKWVFRLIYFGFRVYGALQGMDDGQIDQLIQAVPMLGKFLS